MAQSHWLPRHCLVERSYSSQMCVIQKENISVYTRKLKDCQCVSGVNFEHLKSVVLGDRHKSLEGV